MLTLIVIVFVIGYLAITTEHTIKVNKAASALITGVLLWTIYILFSPDKELVIESLNHHLGDVSGILFFLLGAMRISTTGGEMLKVADWAWTRGIVNIAGMWSKIARIAKVRNFFIVLIYWSGDINNLSSIGTTGLLP
jgi:hypothetical protein